MNKETKKIKVFVTDEGDTPIVYLTLESAIEHAKQSWLAHDFNGDDDELGISIKSERLTRKQINELPEA